MKGRPQKSHARSYFLSAKEESHALAECGVLICTCHSCAPGQSARLSALRAGCTYELHKHSARVKMRQLRDQCFSHMFLIPSQGISSDIRLGKELCFLGNQTCLRCGACVAIRCSSSGSTAASKRLPCADSNTRCGHTVSVAAAQREVVRGGI